MLVTNIISFSFTMFSKYFPFMVVKIKDCSVKGLTDVLIYEYLNFFFALYDQKSKTQILEILICETVLT